MTDELPGHAEGPAAGIVHVVEDDEGVRQGIALLLRAAGYAVATHESGLAFLEALSTLGDHAGCVLTDVRMPGLDGLGLLRQLRQAGAAYPVIVMTAHGDVSTAVQAMKLGALDFIEKPFDDDVLLSAIASAQAIRRHDGHDGHAPTAAEVESEREAAEAAARLNRLSPREREVLDLLTTGKPNKAVAQELGLSPRTVEVHRARMLNRLGVGSLAEAVRLSVRAERVGGSASEGR